MNKLQIFKNNEFGEVRTIDVNGTPFFVGKDVADILGYNNSRDALAKHVDGEDKGVAKCDTLGGIQTLTVINESGLYSLILSSKMSTAKRFKHWVTAEVLPAIRKHGVYAVDELLNNPEFAIKAFTALKQERDKNSKLTTENAQQKQLIGELTPKADYTDRILQNKGLVTITQIAKDYGMSGRKLNQILSDMNIQYKQSGQWLLYRKYHGKGYTHSKTIEITRADGTPDIVMETKWTQKGRLFLYELLRENEIYPVIEGAA